MKRIFSKEFMQSVLWEEEEGSKILENKIEDTSRWSIIYSLVFSFENKIWECSYSVGAAECQDERPWEYDEEVECWEVRPVEKIVTIYEAVKD